MIIILKKLFFKKYNKDNLFKKEKYIYFKNYI